MRVSSCVDYWADADAICDTLNASSTNAPRRVIRDLRRFRFGGLVMHHDVRLMLQVAILPAR